MSTGLAAPRRLSARVSTSSNRRGRYWWLACCALLTAIPFATDPGQIISDTKFELAVNPSGFLSSALTLWDPQQFGGLLNQAYGYLFPMGPFFELLRLVAVEGWMVQRLWIAALLVTAFTGTAKLAGRLGITNPSARAAAGLVYALSPTGLSIAGVLSGELLPMVLLPWIILPLTDSHTWTDGSRWERLQAVARSAVAIALCSGMNAASTLAVLLPAGLYVLTRKSWRMLAWWIPAMIAATVSWSVPLVLLGKYEVSNIPYTESAQVTTSVTSLLNVLRGTSNWVSYLFANGQTSRPLGFELATNPVVEVLAGLLTALCLAGLIRRDMPERLFLLVCALAGIVIVSLGYHSDLGDPLGGALINLINGPGAAFRNLWKFDPMLRLPLAFGLGWLCERAGSLRWQRYRAGLAATAAVCLAGLVIPAFTTGLASAGSFSSVPSFWVSAADWLTANAGNQAVLMEPGAPFGQYIWGSPMDDVLAALTNVDYTERDLDTVGSVGNERLLDAIDTDLSAGDGSAGLTQVLARMGVKYVVVRNDLSRSVLDGAWPARISDALADSPGMTLVAQFGPDVTGGGPPDAVTDVDTPYPAVEVYQVAGAEPIATVQSAADTLRVYGGPEALIPLADEGLLGKRPVLLNDDGAGLPTAGSVVTDSLRRRVVNFGQLRSDFSPTLTATQPLSTFLSTSDYLEPGWSKYEAIARYTGIANVAASSSGSDITAQPGSWASGLEPYSAVDGSLSTMWESDSANGPIGQWIQEDFDSRLNLSTIKVAFADNAAIGPPVTQVTVSTAAGEVTDSIQQTGSLQKLRVPAGTSSWLRITVTGLAYQADPVLGSQVGIAGIEVPGVTPSETIVAPTVSGGDPTDVVLSKAQPLSSSCMLTSLREVCSPELNTSTEEEYGFDQSFTEATPERATIRGSAFLINPALVDRYAQGQHATTTVTGSSTYVSDPQDQPRNAFDGNPETSWIASENDNQPVLKISWGYSRSVREITIERPPGASSLAQVLITGSGGQIRGGTIGTSGLIRFAPMRTTSLTLTFSQVQTPLQVSEVVIPGVRQLAVPSGQFRLPCGFGPQLRLDGRIVRTRVTGTFADLLNRQPMEFTACSTATVRSGDNEVTEPATDSFDIQDVVLGGSSATASNAAPAAAKVLTWTAASRTVRVAATTRSYLIVNQNFNAGWRAVIAGRTLPAVQLDGWKQAWVLPAGTAGVVTLTYQPQMVFTVAVIGGLGLVAVFIVIALIPVRRRRGHPPSSRSSPSSPFSPSQARWRRWARAGAWCAVLAATGVLLGGYPGLVLLPVVALVYPRVPRRAHAPVIAGLFALAAVVGTVGLQLQTQGDTGPVVGALSDAVPQLICLLVVGCLAGNLVSTRTRSSLAASTGPDQGVT